MLENKVDMLENLIELVGASGIAEPTKEMEQVIDCIIKGMEDLKTRNIELVLKQNHTIHDVAVEVPEDLEEGQEEFSHYYALKETDRELIYQFFQLMYVNYKTF